MRRIEPVHYLPSAKLVATAMLLALLPASMARAEKPLDFNRDVRPLLADRCFFCHGPDPEHREAFLRLDVEENAKDYVIVPGEPEESPVVERISSDDPDLKMPPPASGKKLNKEEIALLRRWIAEGAKYDPYWAYQPPKRHALPEVKQENWPRNWTDRFILARLEDDGLEPSPAADPVTLVRRLYFDLTGLPPSPEEVQAYLNDKSPHAYENLVDRLLASQRYGERMAVYWLDLVRYADTVGYHGDQDHNISPYRDYVIESFNRNLPFDQFTREQLAGDLVEDSGVDQKIASGYNRLLQTSHEGGVQPKEYLAIYAADRVRNVSAVWMGATVGCAQCHDHKYDPYSAKDFYSLAAFFADVDEAKHFKVGSNSLPSRRPPEIKVLTRHEREQIAALEAQIESLQSAETAGDNAQQIKQIEAEIKSIREASRTTMITVAIEPREMRILPRGDWLDDSGPLVESAVPQFMGSIESDDRLTRLDLANWLTDTTAAGGLTARVMANRYWYLMFGVGISKSLDDFGGQGEPPVYPQLLDNLAVEFHESGWDTKHMMKLIAMSSAYRQSSAASAKQLEQDPYNRLYARQSRYRLPAEMIRDNALAISGLLQLDYGGASVKPYQPAGYYRHLNFPKRKYTADQDQRQWRRGVYMHWQRQFLHPMLKAFDAPSREECTAQRPHSNTPLAALTMLNDPTFVEAARVFAAQIIEQGGSQDNARLSYAFQQAINRHPDQQEREILTSLLKEHRETYRDNADRARQVKEIGLAKPAAEVDPVEQAAWTAVARAILNMNETITRN